MWKQSPPRDVVRCISSTPGQATQLKVWPPWTFATGHLSHSHTCGKHTPKTRTQGPQNSAIENTFDTLAQHSADQCGTYRRAQVNKWPAQIPHARAGDKRGESSTQPSQANMDDIRVGAHPQQEHTKSIQRHVKVGVA